MPSAPVRDVTDSYRDEHMHSRGMLEWMEHPELGPIVANRSPLRFEGTPKMPLVPSGRLGQHSHEVLRDWLGYGDDEIQGFADKGVI